MVPPRIVTILSCISYSLVRDLHVYTNSVTVKQVICLLSLQAQ